MPADNRRPHRPAAENLLSCEQKFTKGFPNICKENYHGQFQGYQKWFDSQCLIRSQTYFNLARKTDA
jgi:hypothetical protein